MPRFLAFAFLAGCAALASDHDATSAPPSVSPEVALSRLTAANAAFVSGQASHAEIDGARRAEVAQAQHPYCTLLSCADSRVPVEHIFQAGIGEVFTVRVAGNIADPYSVASIEYSVEHLGSELIVVMGHERCGAVKAALAGGDLGLNLNMLVSKIKPALSRGASLDQAVASNVRYQMDSLLDSAPIAEAVAEGKVKITGGIYDLDTGTVSWMDHTAQKRVSSTQRTPAHPVAAVTTSAPAPAEHAAPAGHAAPAEHAEGHGH